MAKVSAKLRERNASAKEAKITLDTVSEKRRPGPQARMRPSEIAGRADNNRWILNQVWDRLWPLYDRGFMPFLAGLVIKVMNEPNFPKRRSPRINFLADSLAGVGCVAPRRSRDICEEERARASYLVIPLLIVYAKLHPTPVCR
jgi:hypothetical protein